jgi:hypothetical protein
MHNTLESHKFFPYVAWSLVIGFAAFTYMLTVNVQKELGNIGDGVERLEMRLNEMDAQDAKNQVAPAGV